MPPKRVSEAQREMQGRLAEYQKKLEKRKIQEALAKAEKEAEKARRRAEEEEKLRQMTERYKTPPRTGRNRSRSPLPDYKEREAVKKAEEERLAAQEAREKAKAEAERAAREAEEKAREEEEKAKEEEEKAKAEAELKAREAEEKAKAEAEREAQEKAAQEARERAEVEAEAERKAQEAKEMAEKAAVKAQKEAREEAAAIVQEAKEALQTAADARMDRWKEQQEKRRARAAAENGGDSPVERVPKLSALLAMGVPEADEFQKQVARAKLATWNGGQGDRWQIVEQTFDGVSVSEMTQEEVLTGISVEEALETFQTNPERYLAMHYWPDRPDPFTFILRAGTVGYQPQGIRTDGGGRLVIWRHMYKRLEPLDEDVLPLASRDEHTDSMTFEGKKLHEKNKPLLPGRGMGMGDEANMEMIGGYAQPDHIRQGACVGDCWLLSAIACLADFDWAVQRLFRKTAPALEDRPQDQPNQYTVTLWDLETWKEVDVVVDERLPVRADGSGYLLGAKPSRDGKFWVPYLEKAIAVHCGGYDKICGGNCTDAWPLLTGSRNQFMITKNPKTGKYQCGAKYNPQVQKWSDHSNSPHDSDRSHWRVDWPLVGGGGDGELELNEAELFKRVIAWDENNFLIGAATSGSSDKQATDGIVDNHAYSVIDSRQNICGTGIDLLLIRNPWGEGGELQNGQFMRSGQGWDRYPEIMTEINPITEDNGLCWVTKEEFFRYFPTIYVCALNMTRLKDDTYVNDLKDHFQRRSKTPPKPRPQPAPSGEDEIGRPIYVNKESDPNSPYKIVEETYNGGFSFAEINQEIVKGVSIAKGVDEFRANPEKYLAISYQTDLVEKGAPVQVHQFTYVFRDGTEELETDHVAGGRKTMLTNVLR